MPGPLTDTAYAKINLALHVRKRREDGYHDIETLFAFVDNGDMLSVEAADDISLSIEGPFADDLSVDDNLVLRAVQALRARADCAGGAAFRLEKRLPIASGIGGGSADAAAALRLAARLWRIAGGDVDLAAIAAEIGADVPACVLSRTCLGTGTGTDIAPMALDGISGRPILLVNPMESCPTGPVFKAWDGVDRGALSPDSWMRGRNDLEIPAQAICPDISDVMTVLRAQLPDVARMSGSGATCFALFADDRACEDAALRIADDHPDWWVMTGRLR